jgi:hypothetical protein
VGGDRRFCPTRGRIAQPAAELTPVPDTLPAGYTAKDDIYGYISGINLVTTAGDKGVASTTGRGDAGRVLKFSGPAVDPRICTRGSGCPSSSRTGAPAG